MDDDSARKQLHAAIEGARGEETAEAVLISAVVVAEWMSPDGARWISRIASTNGGDETPPTWTTEGLLHHALHGDWTGEDDADE